MEKRGIFENIQIGSLVWAKRYKNENELNRIEKGHEEGPFVILGKKDSHYIALYCTSKQKETLLYWSYDCYTLEKGNTNLSIDKRTYVDMRYAHLLEESQIIKNLGCLSNVDMQEIYKRMKFQEKMNQVYYFGVKPISCPATTGDIIFCHGRKYLVIDESDCMLHLLGYNVVIGDCLYDKSSSISKSEPYQLLSSLSSSALKFVLENYKRYLEQMEKASVSVLDNTEGLSKGDLISFNGKLYLGYHDMKSMLATFEVYPNERSSAISITIANNLYYSYFTIKKNFKRNAKDCEVLCHATDAEMELINTFRNTPQEVRQGR